MSTETPNTICQNPPVTIEEWLDPDNEYAKSKPDVDEILFGSPDQDPQYLEPTGVPACHPDNEGEFDDQELQELLELHLGTIDKAKWEELCNFEPTNY
ncbi:hypothetical protein CTheo_7980 [Ceratobasidium theobromae]|uniref:Uncharacterized protein n=1 Tax=Ceratobasidium theobromae TaxID=1582974 RepID=A0A5N5QAX9_9AGAM|nr:hypothetical protein CTheo_7980 [Ceratobasidium theobromae]